MSQESLRVKAGGRYIEVENSSARQYPGAHTEGEFVLRPLQPENQEDWRFFDQLGNQQNQWRGPVEIQIRRNDRHNNQIRLNIHYTVL